MQQVLLNSVKYGSPINLQQDENARKKSQKTAHLIIVDDPVSRMYISTLSVNETSTNQGPICIKALITTLNITSQKEAEERKNQTENQGAEATHNKER